jgi:phosphoglycolate phosphatase
MNSAVQGLIFDMDNTLLRSRIDFASMKRDVYHLLLHSQALPESIQLQEHTTSTLVAEAKRRGMTGHLEQQVWEVAARYELQGMEGAGLEPGAAELLAQLKSELVLVVVTNNAYRAALRALEETGILKLFDMVVAREQMSELKPSPSGFLRVIEQYPHIPSECWISIGDSWIDGRASMLAGIPFLGYRTKQEELSRFKVISIGRLEKLLDVRSYLE